MDETCDESYLGLFIRGSLTAPLKHPSPRHVTNVVCMVVGARVTSALVVAAALSGCGRDEPASRRVLIERAIDRELGARFGVGVVTQCHPYAPGCVARLPDGGSLPISLIKLGTEWEWRVVGLVITTNEIEAYLREEVADLGAPQGVRCAPKIRRIDPGDRIECWLANGGKAFVTVRVNGSISVEVVLDARSANARSELITPAREQELSTSSRALEHSENFDDDEESPSADAGELLAPAPPR